MHVLVRVDALPGRVAGDTKYTGRRSFAAFQRVAKAHGEHEKLIGQVNPNWPDW